MSAGSPDTLVVDASVAAKWHLKDEVYAEQALHLFNQLIQGEVEVWAPSHIRSEVSSAITAATLGRQPRLTPDQGRQAIAMFLALGLHTADTDTLYLSAYTLVHEYHCAFYDALYVALARQLAAPLVTADRPLYQRLRHLPQIVWLGDYPLSFIPAHE